MKPQFAHLSAPDPQFAAYLEGQRMKAGDMPVVDSVTVANKTSLPTGLIEAHIDIKPGEKLDLWELKRNVDRIYGIDTFERVDFYLKKKDTTSAVVIEPLEKSWGPNYFRFGLGLEDNFRGESNYALTAQFTKTAINSRAGEWRTEVRIGKNPRVYTEFYQPIDYALSYFVAANAGFRVKDYFAYNEDGNKTSQYQSRSGHIGLDVGRELGNWGELRLGIRREYGTIKVQIGDHSGPSDPYNRASFFASAAYSTLDNYVFPLSGTDAYLTWNYELKMLGSDIEVQSLGVKWMKAFTWRKFTFMPSIDIKTTLDNDDMAVQDTFPLGGFLNLSGYAADEIYGRHTGLARLIIYREIGSAGMGAMTMPLYLGGSLETGNVWTKRADINTRTLIPAGSIFIGTKSFLGPIYLAYGQAQRGHSSVYLYLGQRF
jgi:NTE family protein